MVRRRIDDVDPNKILLLTGLGLLAVLTPLITGGLIPTPKLHTLQSFSRVVGTVQQARLTAVAVSDEVRPARNRSVHHSAPASPLSASVVAAPRIQVDMPVIILPEPELSEGSSQSVADASDAPVCRPPQRLPNSQLMGPQVCLSKKTWDRYKAQDLVLMPDGRTLVASYDKTGSTISCMSMVTGASNGSNWATTCH
jgi:hypothetical protein